MLGREDRRGAVLGSGMMFFVFFSMIVLIVFGVAGSVYGFFGRGFDFRETEARQMMSKVETCFMKTEFSDYFGEDVFFEKCFISKKAVSDGKHLIYIKRVSDGKEFTAGVYDFKNRCGFVDAKKNKDFPLCVSKEAEEGGEKYMIITASSQNSRSVAA